MYQSVLVGSIAITAIAGCRLILKNQEKIAVEARLILSPNDINDILQDQIHSACWIQTKPCTVTFTQFIDDDECDFSPYYSGSLKDRKQIAMCNLIVAQRLHPSYNIYCTFEERLVGGMSLDTNVITTFTITNKN